MLYLKPPKPENRLFVSRLQNCTLLAGVVLSGALWFTPAQAQDDIVEACHEAGRLLSEDNDINAALEEAKWCLEGLQQIKQKQALALLPDEVGKFVGGETTNQQALGMSMIEREYTHDAKQIDVSLTGGGAAASGLAALAQMGMNLGAQAGTKIRIQRRTVLDTSEGGDATFMVQLKNGGMINISSSSADHDEVLAFVKAFPIADVDDALKH